MTDNYSSWLKKLNTVYYGRLVPTDVLENILHQVDDGDLSDVFNLILDLLDLLLVYQLAQVITDDELREFIHNAEISYNNPEILAELTEIYPNLEETLSQVVQRQLLAIYSGLQKNL